MPDIGDFIRRSWRSAKIAIAAPGTPCDFRRSRRSAYKIAKCVAGLRPVSTIDLFTVELGFWARKERLFTFRLRSRFEIDKLTVLTLNSLRTKRSKSTGS